MDNLNLEKKFSVELDYKGYLIDQNSYTMMPAPLFGTRFATGRPSYQNLDVWQVGGLTDFSKGCGQQYLVDPSRFDHSEGIDISTPGEIKLERDVSFFSFPTQYGSITCKYRSIDALYLGTDTGKILYTANGSTFSLEADTGGGPIYQIFEMGQDMFATKGANNTWVKSKMRARLTNVASSNLSSAVGTKYKAGQTMTFTSSIKVKMVQVRLKAKSGVPKGEIKLSFYNVDADHKPTGLALGTAKYSAIDNDAYEWKSFYFISPVELDSGTRYAMVISCDAGDPISLYVNYVNTGLPGQSRLFYENENWYTAPTQSLIFKIFDYEGSLVWQDTGVSDLYFVKDAGYYFYGVFKDGVRQSTNGYVWLPEPPDPLWSLPSGDRLTYAISIPRGFLIGTYKGIWLFAGGASSINLREDPANVSDQHMVEAERYGQYAIFGIENRGLFYSAGTSINPTNLTMDSWTAKVSKVRGIVRCGDCLYANVYHSVLMKWYLAKCNMTFTQTPDCWYFVKELPKTPVNISMFNERNIYIHYIDKTCDKYDENGSLQTSGFIRTSRIDENVIRLQKFYRSLHAATRLFPSGTKIGLAYILNDGSQSSFHTVTSDGKITEATSILPNPTVGNNLKVVLRLEQHGNKSPIVTDIMWKYFLERPQDDNLKKMFSFIVISTEPMEALDGSDYPYTKSQIENYLWETKSKKELLNFVGANNVKTPAITLSHSTGRYITIDQTNSLLLAYNGGSLEHSLNLENLNLNGVVSAISNWTGYSASLHLEADGNTSAKKLMPIYRTLIKNNTLIYSGTEIYTVIWTEQSPQHRFLTLEGYGQAKLAVTLREV